MGNEMGNNNVSGLQEEEKSGVEEAPELLLHEGVQADEVKGENHTNPEAEERDFHEKVGDCRVEKQNSNEKKDIEDEDDIKPIAEGEDFHEAVFPSDIPLEAGELRVEKQTTDENESNDAAGVGSGVRNASSDISLDKDEKTNERPNLEEDLIATNENHIQKEIAVGREDIETSNSTVDSKSESDEVDPKFDQHEVVHAESVGEGSRPGDSEELVELSTSFQAENGHLVDNKLAEKIDLFVVSVRDDQNIANELDNLVAKTKASEEENLVECETCDDKCEIFSPKDAEKSLRKECDGESPLEASESPLEASKLPLEAFPQPSSINSFQEVSEPLEKSIVLTEENKLVIGSEMENGENKLDSNQIPFSEEGDKYFETNESNASRSEFLTMKSDCKESVKEDAPSSGIGEGCEVEESEVNSDEPEVVFVDPNLNSYLKEQQKMEKSIFLTEETKSIWSDLEREENKFDFNQTQFCDQAVKDLKADDFNASQSELMTFESDCKMNEKESALKFNSQVEDPKLSHNENQVGFADKNLKTDFVEQPEESDGVSDRLPGLKIVPTVLNVTDYNHEEDMPREEIEDQDKDSHAKRDAMDGGDMTEQCMSCPISTKHVQDFPPQVINSEADENGKELISHSEQNGCSEFFIITETLNVSPSNAQAVLSTPEKELPHNVQTTSMMIAESETPPVFDEQNVMAQESIVKLITESNSETSSIHVELRKSPSFHFDLSIGARSEESDQTPLCQDKTAARSLSSRGDARFQKDNVQTEYSPQDEAVLVEEKTIRMERSDSEKPTAPFMSLLKKEENAEVLVAQQKQDSHAADNKASKDSWTVTTKQVALTSPRGSAGKRKPISSLFTTWICCANAIP